MILHNLSSTFEFLSQDTDAIFIHNTAQIMSNLKRVLYAYQMAIITNPSSPVFFMFAIENIDEINQQMAANGFNRKYIKPISMA